MINFFTAFEFRESSVLLNTVFTLFVLHCQSFLSTLNWIALPRLRKRKNMATGTRNIAMRSSCSNPFSSDLDTFFYFTSTLPRYEFAKIIMVIEVDVQAGAVEVTGLWSERAACGVRGRIFCRSDLKLNMQNLCRPQSRLLHPLSSTTHRTL